MPAPLEYSINDLMAITAVLLGAQNCLQLIFHVVSYFAINRALNVKGLLKSVEDNIKEARQMHAWSTGLAFLMSVGSFVAGVLSLTLYGQGIPSDSLTPLYWFGIIIGCISLVGSIGAFGVMMRGVCGC